MWQIGQSTPLAVVTPGPGPPRPRSSGRLQTILVIAILLLVAAAFFASTPAQYSGDSRVPNVITPGVEVAEIAYLGTCLALLTVLLAVLHAAALVTQRRRAGPTPQGSR